MLRICIDQSAVMKRRRPIERLMLHEIDLVHVLSVCLF